VLLLQLFSHYFFLGEILFYLFPIRMIVSQSGMDLR